MAKPLAVLIVEDSESDAQLIVRLLTKAGYRITSTQVETAAQMRAALEKQAWEIVISDYSLPEMDGHLALKVLQETRRDIPFIAVSGTMGEETAVAMMKAGAQDYVMKNNLARLAPAVERELSQAAARREHQQAEAALRESETQFQQVVASIPEHIYVSEIRGEGQAVNRYQSPRVEKLTGYPRQKFMDDWAFWLETVIHPADREAAQAQVARLLTGQASVSDYRLLQADGNVIWVRDSARVETNPAGVQMIYGVVMDITERKQAEAQKQAALDALRQKMTELERFNALTVDRELRMIELKKELNALLKQAGQPEKYRIVG